LVSDTVSQSANIVITLPDGVYIENVSEQVKFTPSIKGEWITSESKDQLIYDPSKKLKLDRYYSVVLQTDEGNIGKDFLIKEDPKISAIFPSSDSEAHENSEITIIFNRPMVPLTTLDELLDEAIPVEITPETEGRFKWIGTRTLQFIPENQLIASANYTVSVKNGFQSMDGLQITSLKHNFKTRPLRYDFVESGALLYNQPLRVKFNQSVDLDRMLSGITVEDTQNKQNIEFIAEYGTKTVYNRDTEKEDELKDESLVLIYNKKDQYNRPGLWNFNGSYYLNIQNAYPKNGDINIFQDKGVFRNVTGIIDEISATSERTSFATQHFFDPQGELVVRFFEEINLNRSNIKADGLVNVKYGEACKKNDNNSTGATYATNICELVVNKKLLVLKFNPAELYEDKLATVEFKNIINLDNLQLNKETLEVKFNVIPTFKILKTIPSDGSSGADLTRLILCTNSPLSQPANEEIDNFLTVSPLYEYKNWARSAKVPSNPRYYKCKSGEFQTQINYGLMPETDYQIKVNLLDHFDRTDSTSLSFKTGKMPSRNLNFYHFQQDYNVTTPEKMTLTYAALNMEYVNINICKLSAGDMLQKLENRPHYTTSPDSITGCQNVINKTINLPKRFWIKNHFQVDLNEYVGNSYGHYLLTFSHPDYKQQYGNNSKIYERSYVTVTNLNVVEKKIEQHDIDSNAMLSVANKDDLKNLYWISDTDTLAPLNGARIDLYSATSILRNAPITLERSIYTGQDGISVTPPINNLRGAVISTSDDSALISNSASRIQRSSTARDAQRFYLYTDRPIYRPTHVVNIKGLYRLGFDGDYKFFNGDKIPVQVFNSQNQEIFNKDLEINEFGTIHDSFVLDSKASLGRYRITAKGNNAYFDVEEYVPAPFKVEATTDKEEYISGDVLKLNIDADYFFGVPLDGGEVEYGIVSQRYNFDKYKDEYFRFGAPWYSCYGNCSFDDDFILRNKTKLEQDGTAQIVQELDFKTLFKNEEDRFSKIFVFFITVKNSNGQSVSIQKSLIVHNGEFYLGVKTLNSYAPKGESLDLKVKSVDTNGNNIRVSNVNLSISRVDWLYSKRREVDGGYYYKYEKKLEPISQRRVSTNVRGDWSDKISFDKEGRYEIEVSGTDKRGNKIKDTYSVYIYGSARTSIRPTNNTDLEVITNNSSVSAGEKAEIIIQSPFDKAKALITLERGRVFDYKIVDVNQSLYQHEFIVDEKFIPNIIASVTLISPQPDIKHGQVTFSVNTQETELDIAIVHQKEQYLPGEDVTLEFYVTDSEGRPADTELSVAVADLSVLALKGNPKKNPTAFFYGGFPHTVSTVSNLKNILFEVEVVNKTKGGGGAEPEDLAKRKRGIFKDTAFWKAVLRTGADGRGEARFTLPDNLTSWQVESVGITKDTKVGVGYKEFISRKELMVRPLQPRFIIPGDIFSLGAKVFNQTGERQNLEVSIDSPTLILNKDNRIKKLYTLTLLHHLTYSMAFIRIHSLLKINPFAMRLKKT